MKAKLYLLITIIGLVTSCNDNSNTNIPSAIKIRKELTANNDTRIDNYFWMRLSDAQKKAKTPDKQTQDVLDYLNAENTYLKNSMKQSDDLQKSLFDEIIGRIKQNDKSVPYSLNGYTYITKFKKDQDYPIYLRKKNAKDSEEKIIINTPELAKRKNYFNLNHKVVSINNKLLAYSIDTVSRRQYDIYFKNLDTGILLPDVINNTGGNMVWANDNKTLFYSTKDTQTLRSNKIYKHTLGTDTSKDILVYEEKDDRFYTYISKTKSNKYLVIGSYQTLSTEYRYLDADTPNGEWKVFQPREPNIEYHITHYNDKFYIVTNYKAENFRLMKTSVDDTRIDNWEEVIGHRAEVLLKDVIMFKNYMVLLERKNAILQLRVIDMRSKEEHYIKFDDPIYVTYPFNNYEFDTNKIRFVYSSLTTPNTTYDYDMDSREKIVMKIDEVADGYFKQQNYISKRLFAPSRDGKTQIPISIVYRKDFEPNEDTPILLYGYGSYGYSMDPLFRSGRLSLLDRGFTFAIAHIRGGQELGRKWYKDGKLLKKKNTFFDFIDCGKYLIDQKMTSAKHLYAQGGSAGGLLIGAVINMEPKLWNGAIARVPFVDITSTMLDESIPLTTGEFDEWGNPKIEEYYNYIKSYSPYDNIEKKDYPNLLVTTGFWDSQVQYWEPAKWVAKLREFKTDDNLLLMNCNMEVGHGGDSGRFKKQKETALMYTFLLSLEGIRD